MFRFAYRNRIFAQTNRQSKESFFGLTDQIKQQTLYQINNAQNGLIPFFRQIHPKSDRHMLTLEPGVDAFFD